MIEAVLAGIILVSGITIASSAVVNSPSSNLQERAINLLQALDDRDQLRNWTVSKNTDMIANSILIPSYKHTVQICDHTFQCRGSLPSSTNIFTGSYIIAGDGVFEPYQVKLHIGDSA